MKYQAYPKYKESGVDWLGQIPIHWHNIRLKYVANLEGEKIEPGSVRRYVGMENIESGNGKYLAKDDINPEGLSTSFSKGNILFGKLRPYLAKSWLADFSGICSSEFLVLRSVKVCPRFLNYYTLTDEFINQVDSSTYGSKMPRTSWDFISLMDVPVPYNESEKIANFLDHETAKIDTLIEKQQQLIKLLKEKRQAVISHAVTKGLNPNAPMRDSGVEWLGEVPEHWVVCKLKHIISSLESGVSVNAADIPAYGDELGVLKTSCVYTRSFRVEENKTVLKEEENRVKCPIRKGAIIISRMNTPELVGASALVEADETNIYLPDRLWQTVFASNVKLNPKFIAFFMMIKGFRNQISLAAEGASSSMQNIAKEDYLSINIALPDIAEQNGIVMQLENKLRGFQKLEENANNAIELIQERRTALISNAVTGKIDVRNWVAPALGT